MCVWRGGVVVRKSNLLGSSPGHSSPRNNSGQVVHMHVPLCLCLPSSINWYRHKLGAKQALHVTH